MKRTSQYHLERAVVSLLGGGAVVVVFSTITWFLYREAELPPAGALPLLIMLALVASYAVLGGYVTSAIARRAEAAHALLLGVVLAAGQLASTVLLASESPLWFRLALAVLFVPAAISGAWLRVRRRGIQSIRRS